MSVLACPGRTLVVLSESHDLCFVRNKETALEACGTEGTWWSDRWLAARARCIVLRCSRKLWTDNNRSFDENSRP